MPIDLSDARAAAPALLGAVLVREKAGCPTRRARIVETEAYLPDDPASHSFGGQTKRNATMFGPAGNAYIYRIHRVVCFNIVTGEAGTGEAVLVRAVEPLEGRAEMEAARTRATVGRSRPWNYDLCNGPGKLCQALEIELSHDGTPLIGPERNAPDSISLQPAPRAARFRRTVRIGISKAKEEELRFVLTDSPWLSRKI